MGDRPRHGQAALRRNTSREARQQALGRLPMRNVSRQGEARQDKVANSCISNIRHLAPVDESPAFAERSSVAERYHSCRQYRSHVVAHIPVEQPDETPDGVPVVLEQKTTIRCNYLSLHGRAIVSVPKKARKRPVYWTSTPLTRLIDIAQPFFRVQKIAHSRICQSLK